MISKLVPSPDWFVGLDSLNLCENGHFIDSVTVEVPRCNEPSVEIRLGHSESFTVFVKVELGSLRLG